MLLVNLFVLPLPHRARGNGIAAVHAAAIRHGCRARLRRGRPTPAAVTHFSLLFCAYLCAVMLTSKPVAHLVHRTRRNAACRHVRRCRSPVHVGSPSPAISGNNSSTHGCAHVLACSSTSPSPPASIIRPAIELLRRPLFFKIATRDFSFKFEILHT